MIFGWKHKALKDIVVILKLYCDNIGNDEMQVPDEEFALGIDPKSLHATVLMQMVYNAIIWHSGGFLKHVAISDTEKGRITVAA